jgi:hypothetical protein
MKRIDGDGNVNIAPPTLSSKLSKTDRLENFMLSLQISPINFPACALKISELRTTTTTRHTTAFNDMEMLLRMMCVSDIVYVPKETMHYRVYSGNAAAITSSLANDRATFVGLVELFHSEEVDQVLKLVKSDMHWEKLVNSINQGLDIGIQSKELRDLARNVISESLVRRFGYSNKILADFLINSLAELGLEREVETVRNLHLNPGYSPISLSKESSSIDPYVVPLSIGKAPAADRLINLFSLSARERYFDVIFRSQLLSRSKRPFVKVWRLRGRSE